MNTDHKLPEPGSFALVDPRSDYDRSVGGKSGLVEVELLQYSPWKDYMKVDDGEDFIWLPIERLVALLVPKSEVEKW